MNDNYVPMAVAVSIAAAFSVACLSLKGCNDSDNKLYSDAAKNGCSYVETAGNHEIICPGFKRYYGAGDK